MPSGCGSSTTVIIRGRERRRATQCCGTQRRSNVRERTGHYREFNIGMPPALKTSDRTFNKPEPFFLVKCDVHPWMSSYVAVMTHPYFAVTSATGKFSIDASGLADGSYEVEAWHERLGNQTGTATVSGGGATVDFSFKIPPRKK